MRWMHRLWARLNGYFWLYCWRCGRGFGGHEKGWTPSSRTYYRDICTHIQPLLCARCTREDAVSKSQMKG